MQIHLEVSVQSCQQTDKQTNRQTNNDDYTSSSLVHKLKRLFAAKQDCLHRTIIYTAPEDKH